MMCRCMFYTSLHCKHIKNDSWKAFQNY